ncbi:MAG TPA: DUF5615 family PIN-like protein [Pirellulales bacterium]|nr:DUF5615 family PIN-like protein [Pirellulales bacterium]HVA48163.1 DUF5615 family PIN-like protein [Pirellulales bacterium]
MNLLFDQNLSRRLVALLAAEYPGSEHVSGAGLLGADDIAVWRYAAGKGLVVVSKDSDFRRMAVVHVRRRKRSGSGSAIARQPTSSICFAIGRPT